MRIDSAFPGQYLKAADLQGKRVTVTMAHVQMEDIGSEQKPILYFQGTDKGLVLNKTNSNTIMAAYGYETEDWAGQVITLVEAMVDFQGRTVAAIRIVVPKVAAVGRAGCSGGMLSLVKFRSSLSISGPSAMRKPISAKISAISSNTCDTG